MGGETRPPYIGDVNENSRQLSLSTFLLMLVGVHGFDPWTPWSQTRCATGLRYTPKTRIIAVEILLVKGGFSNKREFFGSSYDRVGRL